MRAITQYRPDAALVQHTRQQPQDHYVLADVLAEITQCGVPTLTDDNYAVMKVEVSAANGATLSTFSCFKLFGPEGVGAVVGKAEVIAKIRARSIPAAARSRGAGARGTSRSGFRSGDVCGAGWRF
jgi:seryl-tRNA(Sec) selenium transferase